MSDRKYLVVVRAGDGSLHPDWLKGDAPRTWDLVVNYFGSDPDLYREPDVTRIDSKGPKWPALHDLFKAHPHLVEDYSHIWLPDDDLYTDKDSINRLFETCETYKLEVAQPALTWNSYTSHMVTLHHSNSLIRYTNFIEIMAPCFSAEMLARCLPLFGNNLSGWGLDFIWKTMVNNPDTGLGIIDTVAVRHTRPIGGPNYKALKDQGKSPYAEWRAFLDAHRIDGKISIHKVLTRSGAVLESGRRDVRFITRLVSGCVGAVFKTPDRKGLMRQIYHFARSNLATNWPAVTKSTADV